MRFGNRLRPCARRGRCAPALAQPVVPAPLAAREVLLEIDAIGAVRTRADRTVLIVQLQAAGANAAAARADLAAREERLVAAAVAAGVARTDIGKPRSDGMMGLVNNEALVQAGAGQAGPEEEQTARKSFWRSRSWIDRRSSGFGRRSKPPAGASPGPPTC